MFIKYIQFRSRAEKRSQESSVRTIVNDVINDMYSRNMCCRSRFMEMSKLNFAFAAYMTALPLGVLALSVNLYHVSNY